MPQRLRERASSQTCGVNGDATSSTIPWRSRKDTSCGRRCREMRLTRPSPWHDGCRLTAVVQIVDYVGLSNAQRGM